MNPNNKLKTVSPNAFIGGRKTVIKNPQSRGFYQPEQYPGEITIITAPDGDTFNRSSRITLFITPQHDTVITAAPRRNRFLLSPTKIEVGSSRNGQRSDNFMNLRALYDAISNQITKKQQGGNLQMNEQELQQQIILLVQAAMSGNQQATQQIQQIMQAAQQGDQQAVQLAQMIQAVAQLMQQLQVLAAKFGSKLNYIKKLRGQCPEGTEMQYYKAGGQLCKKCVSKQVMQDGGEMPKDPIEAFKCGKKVKKGEKGVILPTDTIHAQGKDGKKRIWNLTDKKLPYRKATNYPKQFKNNADVFRANEKDYEAGRVDASAGADYGRAVKKKK